MGACVDAIPDHDVVINVSVVGTWCARSTAGRQIMRSFAADVWPASGTSMVTRRTTMTGTMTITAGAVRGGASQPEGQGAVCRIQKGNLARTRTRPLGGSRNCQYRCFERDSATLLVYMVVKREVPTCASESEHTTECPHSVQETHFWEANPVGCFLANP